MAKLKTSTVTGSSTGLSVTTKQQKTRIDRSYPHKASIILSIDKNQALLIENAISPESQKLPGALVYIQRHQSGLKINIAASDTGSLRAAINSYIRWAKVALEVGKVASDKKS